MWCLAFTSCIFVGCGKQEPAPNGNASAAPTPDAAANPEPVLHQPFATATLSEPPGVWQRPPDLTMTGKSVGKLYTEVVRRWDETKFVNANGSRLKYRAVIDTEEGLIEIQLRPDLAPNHVRNFVALAQSGYYDGLVFERTINEQVPERPDDKLEIIEAGCPLGTGEPGYGSIGYWLKPELHPEGIHEEGAVGACHGDHADTAACKFYINLTKAPFLDGRYTVFGKVTNGLHVARKVLTLPVRSDAEYPEGDRPVKPVVIRKVTIHMEETAATPNDSLIRK
jgi:peptidyl-prolyl cis-trans isomerase B (cyclophilin B)